MRKSIIIGPIFILVLSFACAPKEKSTRNYTGLDNSGLNGVQVSTDDDILIKKLSSVDIQQYIGKEVGEFLKNDTIAAYKKHIFVDGRIGVLDFLSLEYTPSIHLRINVGNYSYIDPVNRGVIQEFA